MSRFSKLYTRLTIGGPGKLPRAFSPVQEQMASHHPVLPPRFLFMQINNHCNLRCTHCDIWKKREEDGLLHRPLSRTREILAEFARMNPLGIVVTCGGEPLMDEEVYFQLCKEARVLGLKVFSVINGTRIQTIDAARRMLEEGPSEVSVSLDAATAPLHDLMRGVSGAFEQATLALELLLRARSESLSSRMAIHVMGMVCNSTYRTLEEFYELVLCRIGADKLKLNFIQPTFEPESGKEDTFFAREGQVDPDVLREILNRCDERFHLGLNPVWKDHVCMYFSSLAACDHLQRGWNTKVGTEQCFCNPFDRNLIVDLENTVRLCFNRSFRGQQLRRPGDLEAYWKGRSDIRNAMMHCNRFCAISHSVRAESSTLAGSEKAIDFLRISLGLDEQ